MSIIQGRGVPAIQEFLTYCTNEDSFWTKVIDRCCNSGVGTHRGSTVYTTV